MAEGTSIDSWQRAALGIRVAQLALNELLRDGAFTIPIHLALGHELVALAVAQSKHDEDTLILSHRNVHYQLALGAALEAMLAEALLREDGLCGGTKGIMNMTAPSRGNIYTSSILGNNLPVACGAALSQKLNDKGVTWVVTGDGAIEEGAFAESLLLASSLGLPIVFIVEDNQWSLATHVSQRRFPVDVCQIATGYGCRYLHLNGSDWHSLSTGAQSARGWAAKGEPTVVQVDLETLGGRWVEDQRVDSSGRRLINYHAGQTPDASVTITEPLFIDGNDPLKQLAYESWFDSSLDELWSESRFAAQQIMGRAPW